MSYPSAPWINKGFAYQSLHLIDLERVRAFVPSDLQIVSVLPGKTLGFFLRRPMGRVQHWNTTKWLLRLR
jgi:hypothetical protein